MASVDLEAIRLRSTRVPRPIVDSRHAVPVAEREVIQLGCRCSIYRKNIVCAGFARTKGAYRPMGQSDSQGAWWRNGRVKARRWVRTHVAMIQYPRKHPGRAVPNWARIRRGVDDNILGERRP